MNSKKTYGNFLFLWCTGLLLIHSSSSLYAADIDIPNQPAKGQIHGYSFIYERAEIREGTLKLRQGKDFFADIELIIYLSLENGEIPAGGTFEIMNMSPHNLPHIHISWKELGKELPQHASFTRGYNMFLEFGQESNKKLPGKIYISLPDKHRSFVAGTFEADIKGFRLINGKPDLTSDSVYTLEHVAQKYIEEKNPKHAVKVLEFRDGTYTEPNPSKKFQRGYVEMKFQVGVEQPSVIRVQFIKDLFGWRVFRTLSKNQTYHAHPIDPDLIKEPLDGLFAYLAAKKIEEEVHKQFPERGIYINIFSFDTYCAWSPPVKMGDCKMKFTLEGDEKPVEKAYLFQLTEKGWTLSRELEKNETVNYERGTIEKKE